MQTNGRFSQWMFSAPELIAAAVTAISITLWSVQTFQSKQDASNMRANLERRIDVIENQVATMRQSIEGVAKDVSYIRGRIEPKAK